MERNKIKVLLIDDYLPLCKDIAGHLQERGKFQIVGKAHNAVDGLSMILETKPDVAVVDLMIPLGDGIYILEYLKENPPAKKTEVIVLTALVDNDKTRKVMELGAYYYILKPFSMDVLARRIEEAHAHMTDMSHVYEFQINESEDREEYYASLLLSLGVPSHVKGFAFMKKALHLMEGNRFMGLTKAVYPELAKEFRTNASCVERAIRNAIEQAWAGGMAKPYYHLLGQELTRDKRPSNGAFLSALAELSKIRSPKNGS